MSSTNFAKVRTADIRIGVVGLYASGKTVFLTSLINHLRNHDPGRFRLGDGTVTLRKFREHTPEPDWGQFEYERFRDAFVGKCWPGKTRRYCQ
jgi:predicted YcjX-like family ATPase